MDTGASSPTLATDPASGGGEDRILTVPNLITLARMCGIPVFVWLLFARDARFWAAVALLVIGGTDWIDGRVARRFGQVSNLGKAFDPVVDRLLLVVAVVSILIDRSVPWPLAAFLLVREVSLSSYVLAITAMGAERMDVTWAGKCATFGMMGALPTFLAAREVTFSHGVQAALTAVAWAAAIPAAYFSVVSFVQYLRLGPAALRAGREHRIHPG